MRELGTAVESYAARRGKYPPMPGATVALGSKERLGEKSQPPAAWPVKIDQRVARLERILSPRYIQELPVKDAWGNPMLYATTKDRQAYTIVSTNRDGRLDPAYPFEGGTTTDSKDDFVYADGVFIAWPEGT